MSYPVQYCPYCQREMPESDIWQLLFDSWREKNWTESTDSTTIDTGDYEIEYLSTKEEG